MSNLICRSDLMNLVSTRQLKSFISITKYKPYELFNLQDPNTRDKFEVQSFASSNVWKGAKYVVKFKCDLQMVRPTLW